MTSVSGPGDGTGYETAGVRGQGDVLSAVDKHLTPTFSLPHEARVLTGFGGYASVLQLTPDVAIAMCTDGVGSKTIVASALDRYDTIGYDCVAMNVNDLVCVGATPIALVDYLGVHTLDAERADQMLAGLASAAEEAMIAIPGGEIAQLPEVIGSNGRGPGDERAFDLVGTCVGTMSPGELITGAAVRPGDVIVGLASSGLHSNGYTLARRVLLKDAGLRLADQVHALGRTLGDELLEPTLIYVKAARALRTAGIDVRGLAHVTGDGLANLCRLGAACGYRIEELPAAHAIFTLIAQTGSVPPQEMYRVFNMGIGFVVVVPPEHAARALDAVRGAGYEGVVIGRVIDEPGLVEIVPAGLAGGLLGGDGYFEAV